MQKKLSMCKFWYFLCFLCFIGCELSVSHFSPDLKELDELLDTDPKLVLDSLSHLDISGFKKADQAYFYLLEASAKDKNYQKLSSDSTLRIAEKYFSNTHDYYNIGRTQYYIAKYLFSVNNPTDAFVVLKEAENNINKNQPTDFHLLGLIYSQRGAIHARQGNYQEAQTYYEKSLISFTEINDTISMLMTAKQLVWSYISQEKFEQSKEVLINAINLIDKNKKIHSTSINKLHASLLNALSHYYQNTLNLKEAINSGKKAIEILEKNQLPVPSHLYCTLITSLQQANETNDINYYCNRMLLTAQKENNWVNLIKGYKLLISFEEAKGHFEKVCTLQKKYISLKDNYNKQLKFNEVITLEKKYNYSEKERLYYKAKNKNLWLFIFILILIVIASFLLLYYSWLHRKLKDKNFRLSEQIKKVEWGFTLFKELIRDNSKQYTQLESILNRYAVTVPSQLFEEFRSLHHTQQISYSQRLFLSLTNINKEFSQKLKRAHPDLAPNEILLASMIHYQWELEDIAQVFQTSLEAIQKRNSRLKTKLERKHPNIENLEEYLSKI